MVLNHGCGEGLKLARVGVSRSSVKISPKNNLGVDYFVCDGPSLPIRQSFDCALAVTAMHLFRPSKGLLSCAKRHEIGNSRKWTTGWRPSR